MRTLRTLRLRMVPVTIENARVLWTILQQPDLRMYQDLPSVSGPTFSQMVARRPKRLHAGATGRFEWLIYPAQSRRAAGWVSLRIAERDTASGEVGYSVVRDQRGRGVATEAVCAIVEAGFEDAGLSRINAYCVPENAPSRRVLEHAGFSYEGVLPHGATVGGTPVDVLMHRLERETWLQSENSIVTPASAYPA